MAELSHHKKYGFIITNPPYGERLEDKETLPAIYSAFGKQFAKLDSWSAYMITSYDDAGSILDVKQTRTVRYIMEC